MVSVYIPQSYGYYRIGWNICALDENLRCCEVFNVYHYYYNWVVWSFYRYNPLLVLTPSAFVVYSKVL